MSDGPEHRPRIREECQAILFANPQLFAGQIQLNRPDPLGFLRNMPSPACFLFPKGVWDIKFQINHPVNNNSFITRFEA